MPYKRILLKLSGEALMGNRTHGVDPVRIKAYCEEINELVKTGVEIAIVIGGGNIFRGSTADQYGFERTPADNIGILSTCINGLALHQVLLSKGRKARVMSSRNFVPLSGFLNLSVDSLFSSVANSAFANL